MIFKGSRYSASGLVDATGADGKTRKTIALRAIPPAPSALEYTVVDGERLDTLAARFYSEATRYWLILDANPETLNPFELLDAGAVIHIPKNRVVGP